MLYKCLYFKQRQKKGKTYFYCTKKQSIIELSSCYHCLNKEYNKTPIKKVSKTNKVTKATAIPKEVKLTVWERDKHKCIFCHTPVDWNFANSHFVKRSHLGLGIEENIFTACPTCHHDFDDTPKRKFLLPLAKSYLMGKYDYWNENMLVYKKWGN